MNIWRLITHHSDPEEALAWSLENRRIAIGWSRVGDIRQQDYSSTRHIAKAAHDHYPGLHNVSFSGVQLWSFCHTMKPDDLVILGTGKRRAAVVQVQGDYEFRTSEEAFNGDYRHQRKVQLTQLNADRLWHLAGSQPAVGFSKRWTLIRCLLPVSEVGV